MPPDVLVCDLYMPGMDGFELVRRVHEIDASLPVIVLSAEGEVPGVVRAVRLGIFDFVSKSDDPLTLTTAVTRAFVHGRTFRENERLSRELKEKNDQLSASVAQLSKLSQELVEALALARSSQEQLLAREEMATLGVLASGIAHEINNPLAVVISALQHIGAETAPGHQACLANQAEHEERVAAAREGLSSAERIRIVVRDMMTYRAAQAKPSPTDVAESVRRALRLLRSQVPEDVEVVEELEPVGPAMADESGLLVALINVIANATEAVSGARGLRQIVLRLKEAGEFVEIEVEDSGPGITNDRLPRIFDPFFTTKRPGRHTGMGLSVARNVMKRMGGQILVESQPGKGTVLRLRLARVESRSVEKGEPRVIGSQPPAAMIGCAHA